MPKIYLNSKYRRKTGEKSSKTLFTNLYIKKCWNCYKVIRTNKSRRGANRCIPRSVFCSPECRKEYRSRAMKRFKAWVEI